MTECQIAHDERTTEEEEKEEEEEEEEEEEDIVNNDWSVNNTNSSISLNVTRHATKKAEAGSSKATTTTATFVNSV